MVDKDGINRPDKFDENEIEIKNDTRKIEFGNKYNYRPRNIFFRMWSSFFTYLAKSFFYPFLKIYFKTVMLGKENKRALKNKACIITANHVHFLDDISIGSVIFPFRKIYFLTLARNIRRPVVGFYLRSLGGIPIPDSFSGMKKYNDDLSYLIKHNKKILINPEGSLWPYYRDIRPYKRGAFTIACKNNTPVLPIAILFRKKKIKKRVKFQIILTACKPIYPDLTLQTEKEQSEKLMNEVYGVTKRVADEFYEIQDCGFGETCPKKFLKLNKELFFENDKWIIKK